MTVEQLALLITSLTTFGGLGGTAVLIYRAREDKRKITNERGKLSADAAAVISDSAVALLKPMQDALTDLETRLAKSNERARVLEDRLIATSAELGEAQKRLHTARLRIDELETTIERLVNR